MTFIVEAMDSESSVRMLRQYIRDYLVLDFLFIHEHKLCGVSMVSFRKSLSKIATTFCIEAILRSQIIATKCKTTSIISPKLSSSISANRTILENRAHWVNLCGFQGRNLGFINVYAPNSSQERREL